MRSESLSRAHCIPNSLALSPVRHYNQWLSSEIVLIIRCSLAYYWIQMQVLWKYWHNVLKCLDKRFMWQCGQCWHSEQDRMYSLTYWFIPWPVAEDNPCHVRYPTVFVWLCLWMFQSTCLFRSVKTSHTFLIGLKDLVRALINKLLMT